MINIMDLMKVTGITPILASAEPDAAVPAAKALIEGGVPMVEVLMRDKDSMGNLERIAAALPDVAVGAGTVNSAEQAERVIGSGAKFVVSPGFSRKVVELCLKRGVPVIPGCVTPGEIMAALEYDIHVVKFFPVYQMGGVGFMEQLNGPFPDVRFVTTGGLTSENFIPLIEYRNTLAVGGDWMFADNNALKERNYPEITKNLRKSVNTVLDIRAARAIR